MRQLFITLESLFCMYFVTYSSSCAIFSQAFTANSFQGRIEDERWNHVTIKGINRGKVYFSKIFTDY